MGKKRQMTNNEMTIAVPTRYEKSYTDAPENQRIIKAIKEIDGR